MPPASKRNLLIAAAAVLVAVVAAAWYRNRNTTAASSAAGASSPAFQYPSGAATSGGGGSAVIGTPNPNQAIVSTLSSEPVSTVGGRAVSSTPTIGAGLGFGPSGSTSTAHSPNVHSPSTTPGTFSR